MSGSKVKSQVSHRETKRACKPAVARQEVPVQSVIEVGKSFFTPGHKGEQARIRSVYQLRKQLGIHGAVDAQAESQDLISKTGRAARGANRAIGQSIQTAHQYWNNEARTATGLYRGVVGMGQGFTKLGDIGFRGTKAVAKLGVGVTELGYHALKGEVDLSELARKGGKAALVLAEKGCRYAVSGQLVTDAKKFSKDLSEYGQRVVNDPVLELPKAAVLVGGAVLAIGPERIAAGARGLSGLLSKVGGRAGLGESAGLATAESETALAAATETAPSLAPRAAAVEQTAGTVGGVTPKGWVPRTAAPPPVPRPVATALAPAPPAPVNQELVRNLRRALKLSEEAAPKAPLAPAPVQLPPSNLPLPVKTPVCLPSSNYAPVAPKGFLQLLDRLEGGLDITG